VRFDTDDEQDRRPRQCRVERVGDLVHYLEWMPWGGWEIQYGIDLTPRTLAEFQPRSDALAAGAGDGYFSSKRFATRALDDRGGRVWLLKDRLKQVAGGASHPTEVPVAPNDWEPTLQRWFGMSLPL
jgi:hypothetical protein